MKPRNLPRNLKISSSSGSLAQGVALLGLGLFLSACGPNGPLMAPESSLRGTRYSSSGISTSSQGCSAGAGGTLTSRYTGLSAAAEFSVCPDESDYYAVQVTGSVIPTSALSQKATAMCFFPGEYYAATQTTGARVVYKTDLYGAPMMSCLNLSENAQGYPSLSAAELRFDLTNYNFLYAVRGEDSTRMKSCLIQKDERLCPPYSRGLFRAPSSVNPGQTSGSSPSSSQ
jgi:hypothetical protein